MDDKEFEEMRKRIAERKAKAKAEAKPTFDLKEFKEKRDVRDTYSDTQRAFNKELLQDEVFGDGDNVDLIQKSLFPYSAKSWVGDYPVKSGTKGVAGIHLFDVDPSKHPLNEKAPLKGHYSDVLRPQTLQGPVSAERNETLASPSTRVQDLFPESAFKEAVKGKSLEEAKKLRESFDAQKAMAKVLFEQAPDATNEAVMTVMKKELDDMDAMLSGTSKRTPYVTVDPGKTGKSVADRIYGRGSEEASVPSPTPAQAAYLTAYFGASKQRRISDIKKDIGAEDIPVFETMNIQGIPEQVQKGTRKRTADEVTKEFDRRKGELETPPWLDPQKRQEMLDDKTGEYVGWWSGTKYKSGATREGWGAYTLRLITSPLNIVSTALGSAAISAGAEAGELFSDKPDGVEIKRIQAEARERRGGKAAQLPDDFIGDLADSVMFGKGAEALIHDNFKELGYSPDVGWGIGFGLSLIAPPIGGVPTAAFRARDAFNAEKAIKAAGLLSKTTPVKAGASAASSAMKEAWLWRDIGKATIVPGSAKILAAEDTSKALMLRDELIKADGSPDEIINRFIETHGTSTFSDDLLKAKKAGDKEYKDLLDDVINNGNTKKADEAYKAKKTFDEGIKEAVDEFKALGLEDDAKEMMKVKSENDKIFKAKMAEFNNADKGKYFSGTKKLIQQSDKLFRAITNTEFTPKQGALFNTVIRNAVSRSDKLFDILKNLPKEEYGTFETLQILTKESPDDVKRAVNAVTAFDAFNQITKARGWGEFADLVLITPRFIGTPDAALSLVKEAAQTPIGIITKKITDDVVSGKADVQLLSEGGQSVILNNPDDIKTLQQIVKGLTTGKLINVDTGKRILNDLNEMKAIKLYDIRRLQDLNIEMLIRKKGKGIDTSTIKMNNKQENGFKEKHEFAKQFIAKQNITTPAELRSILDGVITWIKVMRNNMSDLQLQRLDLPPESEDIIIHLAEKLSKIDVSIKQLMSDLMGANPILRKSYGIPESGVVTPGVAFEAIVKKQKNFMNTLSKILLSERRSENIFSDMWKRFSWSDTSSLSDDGEKYLKKLIEDANKNIQAEIDAVIPAVKTFVKNIDDMKRNGMLWNRHPADNKMLFNKMLNTTDLSDDDITKLIGSTLAKSFADNIIDDVKNKLDYDEVLSFVGKPVDDDKLGRDIVNVLSLRQKGESIPKELAETALYADEIIRKAALNSNVSDVIDGIVNAAFGISKLPQFLSRGKEVDDIITEIVTSNNFKPIMNTLTKEISSDKGTAQRVAEVISSLLKMLGGIRYHMMLYYRPGYHAQNIMSAYPMMYATIGGKNLPSPRDMGMAMKTLSMHPESQIFTGIGKLTSKNKSNEVAFVSKLGKPYTYRDLYEIGIGSGQFKTEQQALFGKGVIDNTLKLAEEMNAPKEVKSWLQKNWDKPFMWPANFANETDNTFRTAAMIRALKEGKPIDVAQTIGKRSLLDYGTLTEAEKEISSRILIFYTFQRLMAEELIKSIASPEKAARFVKQMTATKNINDFIWEKSGGDKYDISRFSGFGLRTEWVKDKERQRLPSLTPSGDAFFMLADMFHQETPFDVIFDTETGAAKFLGPVARLTLPETEGRKERLRLVDPNHVALWQLLPDTLEHWLGELKPLHPKETDTKTYEGKEWQLSPEGYARYKVIKKAAELMGATSTVGAWSPVLTNVNDPSHTKVSDKLLKLFGISKTQTVTALQQEAAVIEAQLKELKAIKKQREEQKNKQTQDERIINKSDKK